MSCLVAGCIEAPPSSSSVEEKAFVSPGISGDSCTPAGATYASCAIALNATNTTEGCFSIASPFGPSTTVARSCRMQRILVMQLSNNFVDDDGDRATPDVPDVIPASDQVYLDTVIENLTTFMRDSSYGRLVVSVDVAGDQTLASGDRWFQSLDSKESPNANRLDLLQDGQTPRPLEDYDSYLTLATYDGRSHANPCKVDTDAGKIDKHCAIVLGYRDSSSNVDGISNQAAHETGHNLGLGHEHSLSSATGFGPVQSPLQGLTLNYGGRSSNMGHGPFLFNLPERVELGFLNDGTDGGGRHVVEVASTGSPVSSVTTFDTLENNVEGKKGVFMSTPDGVYWIEARRGDEIDEANRSGVILHFGTTTHEASMVDGTPETPAETGDAFALPLGRTFADRTHHIYVTARSETDSTATVEIWRDPVDANAPVISSVVAIDCTASPSRCPNSPPPIAGSNLWRYEVTASDADGDPLSYSWRFGESYDHGAAVYHFEDPSEETRAFVIASDRKGKEATGTVDLPNYRAAWVAPDLSTTTFKLVPIGVDYWTADNQLSVEAKNGPTGTEILDYSWTIDTATSTWQHPIIAPPPIVGASGPSCIDVRLRVSDTSNCSAKPTLCDKAIRNTCVANPLRILYGRIPGTTGVPPHISARLEYDAATLFPNGATPTITWSGDCLTGVAADQMSATAFIPGCKLTVLLDGKDKFTVTATVR